MFPLPAGRPHVTLQLESLEYEHARALIRALAKPRLGTNRCEFFPRFPSQNGTRFSGTGDSVTDKISCSSGVWHFSHDGSSNFVVRAYTTNGTDLLVNTIGSYDGKKSVDVPKGSVVLFEINADGNWSAEKQ